MKISGINKSNISFGSLHFGPTKKEHGNVIINPNLMKLNNIAKDVDVYIKSDDFLVKNGGDYEITIPVLEVSVTPLRHPKTQGLLRKNTSNILTMTYTFKPEGKNPATDFLSYLKDAVDTVSK